MKKSFLSVFFILLLLTQRVLASSQLEALYLEFFPKEGRILGVQDVVFRIEEYYITADWMEILLKEGILKAKGNVILKGPESMGGEELEFSLFEMEGILREGELKDKEFRLEAKEFSFSSHKVMILDGYYSPCPHDCHDIYFKANRFELTPDLKLTAYGVRFYFLGKLVMYLPRYSGWIRQNRFYPSSPIPRPGYNTEKGFYVDLQYSHWVNPLIQGSYNVSLSKETPLLMVDYSLGPLWDTALRYGTQRQGFMLGYKGQGVSLDLLVQEGENFFLHQKKKDLINFFPSFSLQVDPLDLGDPLTLSALLSYGQISEGEQDYNSRYFSEFKVDARRLTLRPGLTWKGDLISSIGLYGTGEELYTFKFHNGLAYTLNPLFNVRLNNSLVGLEGTTPFLFDDPLPGEEMPGIRSYWNLSMTGRATPIGVGLRWELGGGLVNYPTGDDYTFGQLQLITDYRPWPSLRLTTDYLYREVEGLPLLKDDKKTRKNNLKPALTYSLRSQGFPSLTLDLKGDYSFHDEDWHLMTIGLGTSYGRSVDRFHFHLGTTYDILKEDWDDKGLLLGIMLKSSLELPFYEFALESNYNLQQGELKKAKFSIKRVSPCYFIQLKAELIDRYLEVSFGTNF